MLVIYSECEEAASSSASMLGKPTIHSSLPPPSLLSSFFQTTSNAEKLCKAEGAKAEEKRMARTWRLLVQNSPSYTHPLPTTTTSQGALGQWV